MAAHEGSWCLHRSLCLPSGFTGFACCAASCWLPAWTRAFQPPHSSAEHPATSDGMTPSPATTVPALSGTLPPSWGAMANLHVLSLFENQLNGTLPDTWSRLASLVEMDLSSNPGLTGGWVVRSLGLLWRWGLGQGQGAPCAGRACVLGPWVLLIILAAHALLCVTRKRGLPT